MRDGQYIEGRVLRATRMFFTYRIPLGNDSATIHIKGTSVLSVKYADGRTWKTLDTDQWARLNNMNRSVAHRHKSVRSRLPYIKRGYKNVITLNAPQIEVVHGLAGFNLGIEYERYIDKKGYFSVFLPFYPKRAISQYFGRWGGVHYGEILDWGSAIYFGPGLSFHPLRNIHRVDISIGLQYTVGTFESQTEDYSGLIISSTSFSISTLSTILNINFHSKGHFMTGVYCNYGMSLVKGRTNPALFEIGFKIGARF